MVITTSPRLVTTLLGSALALSSSGQWYGIAPSPAVQDDASPGALPRSGGARPRDRVHDIGGDRLGTGLRVAVHLRPRDLIGIGEGDAGRGGGSKPIFGRQVGESVILAVSPGERGSATSWTSSDSASLRAACRPRGSPISPPPPNITSYRQVRHGLAPVGRVGGPSRLTLRARGKEGKVGARHGPRAPLKKFLRAH